VRTSATLSASCLVAPAFSPRALAQIRHAFLSNYASSLLIRSLGASQDQRAFIGSVSPDVILR
jgi:hypothetical protein